MRTRGIERAVPALLVCLLAASACGDDGEGDGAADDEVTTTEAGGDTGDGSGEISVLAYNVAGLPQEISTENPETNIPLISPLLEPFDIVLTQEDFDWWGEAVATLDAVNYHDRLRADVTHEFQSTQHPGPEAVELLPADRPAPLSGDGLGTLSRFPIDERDRVPWIGCFGGADTTDGGAGDCLAMKGFSLTVIDAGRRRRGARLQPPRRGGRRPRPTRRSRPRATPSWPSSSPPTARARRSSSAATPTSTPRPSTRMPPAAPTSRSGTRSSRTPGSPTPARPPSATSPTASTSSRSGPARASTSRP